MAENEDQAHRYVSAFIPQAMRSALEQAAAQHDRSLSGEIRVASASTSPSRITIVITPTAVAADERRLGDRLLRGALAGAGRPGRGSEAATAGAPPSALHDTAPRLLRARGGEAFSGGRDGNADSAVTVATVPTGSPCRGG